MNGQESAGARIAVDQAPATEPPVKRTLLWFGVLGPPVAWALQLFIDYYISSLHCAPGFTWVRWGGVSTFTVLIFITTFVLAVVDIAAGLGAWRIWRRQNANGLATVAGVTSRVAFMALGGMLLSLYFLVLIIVSGVPNLTLGCAT